MQSRKKEDIRNSILADILKGTFNLGVGVMFYPGIASYLANIQLLPKDGKRADEWVKQ